MCKTKMNVEEFVRALKEDADLFVGFWNFWNNTDTEHFPKEMAKGEWVVQLIKHGLWRV